MSSLNKKSVHVQQTNVKRLMNFVTELEKNPSEYYEAKPSEDITIWYVKIKNLSEEYTGGVYYMKIHFTEEYPFKAPDYYMLTPSGRFDINRKICFSNSGYHSESWSPLWGINQIIMGTISFFYERNSVGISHINTSTSEERAKHAISSVEYNLKHLANIEKMFTIKKIEPTQVSTESVEIKIMETIKADIEKVIEAEPVIAEPAKVVKTKVVKTKVASQVIAKPAEADPAEAEPKIAQTVKKVVKTKVASPVIAKPAEAEPKIAEPKIAEPKIDETVKKVVKKETKIDETVKKVVKKVVKKETKVEPIKAKVV
jgi:ubiquitin-protein ligase